MNLSYAIKCIAIKELCYENKLYHLVTFKNINYKMFCSDGEFSFKEDEFSIHARPGLFIVGNEYKFSIS